MGEQYPSRSEFRKQRSKGESKFKKLAIRTGIALFIFFFLFVGVLAVVGIAYVKDAPPLNPEQLVAPQSSTIYDMNNKKVLDIAGEEYRKTISLDQVPERVQNAFLAVEDARFWSHQGIDIKRIGGALVENVKEGFGAEGGSTITQQLVKLSYLSSEKTVERKIQEMYLALKLERKYSKEEILELYLNKVYFGEGTYGIATASEVFFSKSVEELTISEAALLAGLPQRPSAYNPIEYPELAEKRRDTVLSLMEKHGFISAKEKKEAQLTSVKDLLKKQKKQTKYQSFIDHVIEELKEKGIHEKAIYTEGLKIYTTLDPKAQEFTEKVLMTDEHIDYPDEQFRASVALLDTETGEIRALGGRRNMEEDEIERGFNYATQLKRQPGSTAKPIMAYGPAIEKLNWTPNQMIKDEPIELNGKVFRNWNNKYHGNVTMKTALQWSYNIPAIKTMQAVGSDEVKDFAGKLGIELDEVYPAYAIGGFKDGVSPLQLAGAFAAFGNEGVYNQPHAVRKIVYLDGRERKLQPESVKAMSERTAYLITDMLKAVVTQGTGQLANIPGLPLAGKTGTNQLPDGIYGSGAADAWFVGYTTRYTASVWIGYDKITQETYVKSNDTRIARLIFKEIMAHVSEGKETPDFKRPSSVRTIPDPPPEKELDDKEEDKSDKGKKEEDKKKKDNDKDSERKKEEKDDNQKKDHDENKGKKDKEKPEKPKPEKPKDEEPPKEDPEPEKPDDNDDD
ncbi:transglycosylase domain-containing protein [Pueribacillus sp. YX66]|uniref:transglycosylase domain-containing protein n=1 Tax=Pueribacillus sp. YX66 TaxID=3229242 RepID=UPI00358D4433